MTDNTLSFGDIQAIFLRSHAELQRHIRKYVRCAETAADLTQDLFLKLDRIADRLPNEAEARRFLFRMATNIALDHHRVRTNRIRLIESMVPLQQHEVVDAAAQSDTRDELERVMNVIAALPVRQRTIFMQSRLMGLTYPEIAARHKISASLVEKEVAAALRSLLANSPQESRASRLPASDATLNSRYRDAGPFGDEHSADKFSGFHQ